MLSLSIKEIRFFKFKYVLIGFILFFIAALVFIISGLANGLANDNASAMKNMNAQSYYVTTDSENRMDRSSFPVTSMEKIKDSNAQPLGIQMLSLKNKNTKKKVDITLMTVNPTQFLMPIIQAGKTIKNDSKNEAVVDVSIKKTGAKLGDILLDEKTNLSIKIVGFTENQTYSHTPVVVVNQSTWYTVFGGKQHASFNAIAMKSDSATTNTAVSKAIVHGKWIKKDELVKTIPGYAAEQSSLYMMLAFLIVIAVFVLGAFFYIMTIQKVNQFGILKAIGAKNTFLIGSTILQVLLLSVVSIGLAIGFAFVLQLIMPTTIPFVFDIKLILQFSGALLAVSLVGALFSTISIVKADPLQAMGRAE